MAKLKIKFACTECGTESPKWLGKCPGCSAWNSMVEEKETIVKTQGMGLQSFRRKKSRIPSYI